MFRTQWGRKGSVAMIIAHSELDNGQGSTDSRMHKKILRSLMSRMGVGVVQPQHGAGKEYNSAAPPLGNYDTATGRSTGRPPLCCLVGSYFSNYLIHLISALLSAKYS